MIPNVTTEKNITGPVPHCAGESHASSVNKTVPTMPKADGLKICLPWNLKMYFETTVRNDANNPVYQWLVFNKRHKLNALISTLNSPKANPGFPGIGKNFFCRTVSAA